MEHNNDTHASNLAATSTRLLITERRLLEEDSKTLQPHEQRRLEEISAEIAKRASQHDWGGARRGAGRPKQYIKVRHLMHNQRSEPTLLTPTSDLSVYLADAEEDEDYRRGVVIGDIWYGTGEALAIAQFIKEHEDWLKEK